MATSSLSVARAMTRLRRALSNVGERVTHDRTSRSRAEALLDEVAGLPVAVLIANNSGRYIDVNHHATRLTGYSRAELLSMSVWDLTPKPAASEGRRMWRQFVASGQMSGVYPLWRKNGTQVRANFRAWANVLPGLHVSALATPSLLRAPRRPSRARKK